MYRITYLFLTLPMYCILGFYSFTLPNMISFGLLLFVLFFNSFVIFSKKSSFLNLFIYYFNSIVSLPVSLFLLFDTMDFIIFSTICFVNLVLNITVMFIDLNRELEYLVCLIYCMYVGVGDLYLDPSSNSIVVLIYICLLNFLCFPDFKKLVLFKTPKKSKKKKIKEI